MAPPSLVGQYLLIIEALDAPHSVGLLWKRPLTDNTQETHMHAPGGIRTHKPSKQAAADPRIRRATTTIG